MVVGQTFNSLGCTSAGLANQTNNPSGTTALCSLSNQVSGINSTVHSLLNTFSCGFNPTAAVCSLNWQSGDLIPEMAYQLVNLVFGGFEFIAYAIILIGDLLFLIVFILTIFFPGLFSAGALGSGLGTLGAGIGVIAGILFAGTILIELFYLVQLAVDRIPWFGKH
jgi:hypothetical protein